jgi:membrane protease subunit HflC
MNRSLGIALGAVAVFILGVVLSCVYTIYPGDQVLLTQLGAPRAVISEPGLHFKIPFLQYANFMPRQLLNVETPPSEEVTAQDKKRLDVDAFARWRIVDPLRFYQSTQGANVQVATVSLATILASSIRTVVGSHNFAEFLSQKRSQLMRDIRDVMNEQARSYGVVVVDVRIRRADLPQDNSLAVYRRMQQERVREATEYRAEGDETAQRVRARAEREVTVLIAEATRESDILRGQGDAEKTRILAEAYSQDPEFFAFYRSMQAYQDALKSDDTTLVLSPNSEFFRYFGAGGSGKKK